MSICNANGDILDYCYDRKGNELVIAYDCYGNVIHSKEYDTPHFKNRICAFEDYFVGNSLDTNKWGYEIGYCRNNELQHYRPENAIVSNGNVNLKAIRGHYSGSNRSDNTWTSASITTSNKFEAFYGRWQVKAKFAKKSGSFAAIWLLGEGNDYEYINDGTKCQRVGSTPWLRCGEMDVHECIPGNANASISTLWKYPSGTGVHADYSLDISEWHIYEMEWTPEEVSYLIDGHKYVSFDLTSDSDYAPYILSDETIQNGFYLILNHAVGASGGTPASDINEMDMLVDWVRVYAPRNYTEDMIYAESISIPSTLSLEVGDDVNLKTTWTPALTFDRTTRWESSDESVVTAHSSRIRAISAGTAVVTVTTNNGKKAQCVVTVT